MKNIGVILMALMLSSMMFLSGLASAKEDAKRIQLLEQGPDLDDGISHGELYCVDGYEVFVVVIAWGARAGISTNVSSHQIIGADGKPVRCKLK